MSTAFQLHLPRRLFEEMVHQAITEAPYECCGLLAGQWPVDNVQSRDPEERGPAQSLPHGRGSDSSSYVIRVVRRYPLVNAAASPVEYLSEPRSLFEAVRDMRRFDLEIVAIYHSHPTSDPVPSRTDLERNYSPDVMNLIVSLKGAQPRVRAWWLEATGYREAEWQLVDD